MKNSKFTGQQNVFAFRQAENGEWKTNLIAWSNPTVNS